MQDGCQYSGLKIKVFQDRRRSQGGILFPKLGIPGQGFNRQNKVFPLFPQALPQAGPKKEKKEGRATLESRAKTVPESDGGPKAQGKGQGAGQDPGSLGIDE